MAPNQEKFIKMLTQALVEWWHSLGILAWFGLGILIAFLIVGLMLIVRWIFHGGLGQYTSFRFFGRHRAPAEPPPED